MSVIPTILFHGTPFLRKKIERYMNVLNDVMHRAIQYDELYF